MNQELHAALMTLWEFREFVMRNAIKWEMGANHHNPMWLKVAEQLDQHGMNAPVGRPPAYTAPERLLVWICDMCDARVPEALAQCPACASGVLEFDPTMDWFGGADRDPSAKSRAISRGAASYREGPNYSDYRCVQCDVKLTGQYQPCDHCEDDQTAEPLAATMFRDLTTTVARMKRDIENAETCLHALGQVLDAVPSCRICGCTDDDCSQCIEATGTPCSWVEADLCSACVDDARLIAEIDAAEGVVTKNMTKTLNATYGVIVKNTEPTPGERDLLLKNTNKMVDALTGRQPPMTAAYAANLFHKDARRFVDMISAPPIVRLPFCDADLVRSINEDGVKIMSVGLDLAGPEGDETFYATPEGVVPPCSCPVSIDHEDGLCTQCGGVLPEQDQDDPSVDPSTLAELHAEVLAFGSGTLELKKVTDE